MAENKVIIDVEVNGTQEAQKDLNQVAKSTQAIGDQAKKSDKQVDNLGESFNSLGQTVEQKTKQTTRGIMAVNGGLGNANDSAVTLGRAMVTLADNGSRGMIAILGPIGAVVATIYTLYEGYQNLSGAAKEYEKTTAVAAAVASDLTSKLDNLASKGIRLSSTEMQNMIRSIFDARMGIEYMNEQIAESQEIFSKRIQSQRELNIILGKEKDLVDKNMWMLERWGATALKFVETFTDFRTAQEKVADAQSKVNAALEEEDRYVKELSKSYAEKYEASIKEEQAQIKREATRLESIDMLKAEYDAQMALDTLIIDAYSTNGPEQRALEIKRLQVKAYEDLAKTTSKTKDEIYDEAQRLKELNTERRSQIEALANEAKIKRSMSEDEKRQLETKKKESESKATAFKAKQMQLITEQSQLNALSIQLQNDGFNEQVLLANNAYETAKKLNKNNKNQLLIAEKQYQLAIQNIGDQVIKQQEAQLQEQQKIEQEKLNSKIAYIQKESALLIDSVNKQQELFDKIAILDIQANKDQYTQQLDLLAKNQEIELRAVEDNELAKLEIQKRYALERTNVEDLATSQMKDFAQAQTQAFASSVAGVIMGSQSMGEAIKATLAGLAQEAIARSLFETASGFAALAIGGPIAGASASQHFQAAAMFAGVGAVAGVASKAVGGGGGGSSGAVSPTGQAQTMQSQRPEASKSEPMVFNINFGGAVIYDTKAAAERAFADRIVRQINNSNRGSVRLNA